MSNNTAVNGGGNGNPKVDPNTLKFRRAFKTARQAHEVACKLLYDNDDRTRKNALIMSKYNDCQPFDAQKLQASGQYWRSNRSTGFLSSMVKRIIPQYKQVIDTTRYLTNATLTKKDTAAARKTEVFRQEITNTVRQWKNWGAFCHQIVLENCLFGYTGAAWPDLIEWKPRFLRSDEVLYPDGCPQESSEVPLFVLRVNYQIHELADKLIDPEASEAVGWNIENVVKAINNAQPNNRREGTIGDERKYEDLVRETSIGTSYAQGVDVAKTYHIFVKEANGRVTHYITSEKSGDEIYTKLDKFESMEDCLSLYAIETGNGKLYGSKGAGRILYNTHVAIEQSRNLIADQLYLASLLLLKATARGKTAAAITVQHPVCVLGENFEVVQQQMQINTEAFFQLDRHMIQIAEVQVGAFIPSQSLNNEGSDHPTATEVNYVAHIEQQIREGMVARFYGQFLAMMHVIQRKICCPENMDRALELFEKEQTGIKTVPYKVLSMMESIGRKLIGMPMPIEKRVKQSDAVECLVNMLREGLLPEDIFELAESSPSEVTRDWAQDPGAIDKVVTRYLGNPSVQQIDLIKRDIAATLSNQAAKELVIEQEDGTIQAEGTRTQMFEMNELLSGQDVPISPRDDDAVHMTYIMQKSQPIMKGMSGGAATPETLVGIKKVLDHFNGHLQSATRKGMDQTKLQSFAQFGNAGQALVQSLEQKMALSAPPPPAALPDGTTPAVDILNQQAGVQPPAPI